MALRPRIMMISTHGYVAAEPELGKPDTGGQVAYVLELSRCWGHMGFDVDILTRQFEDQPRSERVADHVRVIRLPCGGSEFIPKETLCDHIPEWVSNVRRWTDDLDSPYSMINSHYWDAGLAGEALAHNLGVPHVHTPHSIGSWKRDNMDGDPDELELKYHFRKRIREEKVIFEGCSVLIATTIQQRQVLEGHNYGIAADKIFVVPPGYDETRFSPVSRDSREALKRVHGLDGRIVLALGRMAHNKGYDLLIRSMVPVFERIEDAKLLLAIGATDPTRREREQIGELRLLADELGIADRVVFRDFIPDDALADFYRMADVFALSSRYEPFGMTAVEAMACGTATIVTTEGGLWEQLSWGRDALYANPFDPQAFGHAIVSVLTYPRIAEQLALSGSQSARDGYTWMRIAQQVLRSLEHITASDDQRGVTAQIETLRASARDVLQSTS
jgi:mannosylfructose-phosphate synthase